MAGPLAGYRVVDFGWVWAGTLLGQVMGLYGAEVIKIESRRHLDGLRLGRVFELGEELEKNTFFQNLNRNKLSATIDISTADGIRLIKELVKKSDVVIENFAPGIMLKNSLDYASLAAVRPDIVMASLSPLGQYGPESNLVTYAPIISALSGIDSLIGYENELPFGFKHAYADVVASLWGLFAVLTALRVRKTTGTGQYIDLSQGESVMPFIGEAFMDYFMNNRVAKPRGNRSLTAAPHGIYPCAGEDRWVAIAVKDETEWHSFCTALGNPDWTRNPSFASITNRITGAAEVDKFTSEWTRQRSDYEAAETLQGAGVAAAPVLNTEGTFLDPHFSEREAYVNVEHPVTGNTMLYNVPWKIEGLEQNWRHAPLLGEHNDYVFGELLGLDKAEITRLIKAKVIN